MDISFKELGLEDSLLHRLAQIGFITPTPIQQEGIPSILSGRDVIACAPTGTGKSAAFLLPLIQHLSGLKQEGKPPVIGGLILAPTRELAQQIDAVISLLGDELGIKHTAVFGGIPRKVQLDYLNRGVDLLVATPGRLLDLVAREMLSLEAVSFFVVDEADLMLKLGFLKEVEQVMDRLPKKRQTLLFSATFPYEITHLAWSLLSDPVHIGSPKESPLFEGVMQRLYYVEKKEKSNLLLHLLQTLQIESAILFVKTREGANALADFLSERGFKAEAIHSERSQRERQVVLEQFRNREVNLLVATDVAARGIDIEKVSHVFNLELPQEGENYIHRIGRTARAGNTGIAITFCDLSEIEKLRSIERLIRQKLTVVEAHPWMNLALRRRFFEAENKRPSKSADRAKAQKRT